MKKLDLIYQEYNDLKTVELYEDFRNEIGMLEIEKYLTERYVKKNDKILDVGCGSGRVTFEMYNRGFLDITALDICENMILSCQKIVDQYGYNIVCLNENIKNHRDRQYDVIMFWYNGLLTIPSYEERKLCVNSITNLLKKGGILMFTTPIIDEDYDWETEKKLILKSDHIIEPEYGDRIYDGKYYIHFPTINEICNLCVDLELIECGICDDVKPQIGRGKSLSYKENYWVYRR